MLQPDVYEAPLPDPLPTPASWGEGIFASGSGGTGDAPVTEFEFDWVLRGFMFQVMSGRMISHYRVVRRLGSGGMGEVLLAEDTQLERLVAIKLMSAELAKDQNQRKRFRAEAKAASGLNHPNICIIYDVGETAEGQPFLAMEFVDGQTLDAVMQRRRLAIPEILALGVQLAEGLEAAHERRVVHRDIKPGNIMLDRRGQVKILDFGLAKRFGQELASETTAHSSALTQAGMLIGTPYYMSPEQVLGRELDHRSDIFSLGVVLYELIAGQKPFLGKTVGETTNSIVNRRPDSLGLENSAFSPTLDKVIFKCLEKDPENRYGDAAQLGAELSKVAGKSEPLTPSVAKPMEGRPALSVNLEKTNPSPHSVGRGGRAAAAAAEDGRQPASASLRSGEPTKLWQLAGKANQPLLGSTAALAAVIMLIVAAAFGFYLVKAPGGRVAFSIAEVILIALASYWWFRRPGLKPARVQNGAVTSAAIHHRSLAVLPFANFSAEKDSDYLSDGLTEEITSALSRLPGLKVAARNSAFAFKGRHENARTIGDALGVTMLLEGSVRKSGQQIRVTAQLVNVADGYHVWSESFDRDLSNIIAVQDEIARRIAERLRMEIGAETSAAMAQRRAVNPDAHVLYLQARHFWNKRTRADIEQAVRLFQRAIDVDPAYADAHAGLGAAYVIVPGYAYRPASEYLPLARKAAARALELDPTSAEAHAVLGDAATQVGDFETSIPHLRRAIELNPNYATGHQWYGSGLLEIGRMEEALVELRRAEELDPLSPIIRACIPEWYYLAGRNEEAIAEAKKAVEIFPEFSTLRKFLAQTLIRKGMYAEAREHVIRSRANTLGAPTRLDLLVFCEARLGNEAQARQHLAELEDWQKQGYDVNEELGCAYLGLREYDLAIEAFERFAGSGILVRSALLNPLVMDELGNHPRFQALLRRLDLRPAHLPDKMTATNVTISAASELIAREAQGNHRSNPTVVIGIGLAVGLVALTAWLLFRPKTASIATSSEDKAVAAALPIQQKSVAVLPFDNFSPEKDTDYLSDGLTDEITAALSRRPGLKVVARNSAFAFKGRKEDLRKVGKSLGVATLLEGSLSKSGRQVRVTAQLINAADGFHLWSETYDRPMDGIIAVQEDIARQIAERLHAESAPVKSQVVAPEAHKLYLQGRVFWNKRTAAGLRKAIDLFQQALEKDATYAAAHAALASSYMLLPQYSEGLRGSQYRPLVRASANRALELDPSCAEAHAVLGMLLHYERDHEKAEEHFRRAMQSDPNYATGYHWHGLCLELSGQREQGLAELQKALDLDPLSPIIHTTIPEWYYLGRDYDRAIAEARRVIETFPTFPTARLELILPLIMKGQLHEALAEIDKARELQPDQPLALLHLKGFCLARLGQETEARKILADLEELRQQGKPMEGVMALIYQGLREYDKEFELAEQLRLKEGVDEQILVDPTLDEVRQFPQFQAFLHRAGLTNTPVPR